MSASVRERLLTRAVAASLALAPTLGCNAILGNLQDAPAGYSIEGVTPLVGSSYEIVSLDSGTCLESHGYGTQLTIDACDGSAAQLFELKSAGTSTYNIINPSSGYCVDVYGKDTSNDTVIQLWTCNGGANQAFETQPTSDAYVLVDSNSGSCIDDYESGTNDGTLVVLWSQNGGADEQWKFVEPGSVGSSPAGGPAVGDGGAASPPPAGSSSGGGTSASTGFVRSRR